MGDLGSPLLHPLLAGRWSPTDWEYSMTLQAETLGLSTRRFRAFDRDGLAAAFAVLEHWEVTTMMAIGRPAGAPASETTTTAPTAHTSPRRQRRTASDILWPVA